MTSGGDLGRWQPRVALQAATTLDEASGWGSLGQGLWWVLTGKTIAEVVAFLVKVQFVHLLSGGGILGKSTVHSPISW